MFHLGWFVGKGYSVHGWNQPYSGTIGTDWIKPDLYIDLAKALDRACFDYMLIEDGSFVSDAYQGSSDYYLKNAYAVPKADPVPLTPLIAYFTKRVGIIPTVTTSFYPPFLAARMGATLDHLTNGRLGLNIVTAHNDRSAQNYGLERHYEHDLRYEMAAEWMQIVNALWTSWQPDAVQASTETGIFTDPSKVAPIHFEGRFYKCRGPLNIPPGPQGRPVIAQAGGSPAGMAFAAGHADTTIAKLRTIEAAKAFRSKMTDLTRAIGRDPKSIKILFSTSIILGDTMEEAQEKHARLVAQQKDLIETKLAGTVISAWSISPNTTWTNPCPPSPRTHPACHSNPICTARAPRHCETCCWIPAAEAWTSSAPRIASPSRWPRPWKKSAATASCSRTP